MLIASMAAQTDVITGAGKQALDQTVKAVLRDGAKESSKQSAKQAVRAAAKESPQLSKIVKEGGEDALADILGAPGTRKLIATHGDVATVIALKHGKQGCELQEFAPAAARSISKLSREQIRTIVALKRAGKITAVSAVGVIEWCRSHPWAASLIGAYVASPAFRACVGSLCDIFNSCLYFVAQHPVISIVIALILIALIFLFNEAIKDCIIAIFSFPKRLLRKFFRKFFPQKKDKGTTDEKKEAL